MGGRRARSHEQRTEMDRSFCHAAVELTTRGARILAAKSAQGFAPAATLATLRCCTLLPLATVMPLLRPVGAIVGRAPAVRSREPAVEWRKIAGLRDILIHQYFGIDVQILRDFVETKLPALEGGVRSISARLIAAWPFAALVATSAIRSRGRPSRGSRGPDAAVAGAAREALRALAPRGGGRRGRFPEGRASWIRGSVRGPPPAPPRPRCPAPRPPSRRPAPPAPRP